MQRIIIAIDGYSSCGKSTLAKALAAALGYAYVDSGAMYRAVTYFLQENSVNYKDKTVLRSALEKLEIRFVFNPEKGLSETFLNGLNVEDQIRTMRVSKLVSEVAAIKDVRVAMVKIQRNAGKEGGIVMDGRDIGSHVFPGADLKIFMTADIEIRVDRRYRELLERGMAITRARVKENLMMRDHIDSTRKENPLTRVDDAHVLDTSYLDRKEQLKVALSWAQEVIEGD